MSQWSEAVVALHAAARYCEHAGGRLDKPDSAYPGFTALSQSLRRSVIVTWGGDAYRAVCNAAKSVPWNVGLTRDDCLVEDDVWWQLPNGEAALHAQWALTTLSDGSKARYLCLTPFTRRPYIGLSPGNGVFWGEHQTLIEFYGLNPGSLWGPIWLAASAWMQEKIIVDSPVHIERHERKRLMRQHDLLDAPRIRTIELRRREYARADTEGGSREYNRQWLVRPHWRRQPCGRERADRKLRYISTHIKGPADKPFMEPTRTYRCSR